MNQTGELIVNRAGFLQILNDMTSFQEYLTDNKLIEQNKTKEFKKLLFKLSEANISLGRVANELQDGVMKARMQPISKLFNRYPRLVRELTYGSDKKVKLNISGIETELDKMVIQEISDPIVHIIRNAVDHGIETTEDRISAGKNEEGNLNLKAYHEGNHVVVEISDDGKGIDPHEIKKIALKKNMMHINELEKLNSREIISLIMKPGFSTSKKITKTSGRGVGMDVVKKNIDKLNGIIEIDSKKGVKTLIRIKLPLTIAIIKALLVRIGNDIFTIPLASVEKTLTVYKKEIFVIENVEVIQLSDSVLSLMRLSEIFNIKSFTTDTDKVFVVIINTGMRKIGIVVDSLLGQEEIVIKPLADYLIAESGFSGATLLGDGKISLILDVYELVNIFINKQLKRKKTASALDTKLQNNNILPDSLNTQEAYTLH